MRSLPSKLLAIAPLMLAAAQLAAHHSVLGFDGQQGTTITGRVEQVLMANPHTIIVVRADNEPGAGERWIVESEGAAVLRRLGWEAGAIEIGDRVTVTGAPARDGSPAMRCRNLHLEDGRELSCFPLK